MTLTVNVLPQVRTLPRYQPGKKAPGQDPVKLSSNENPYLPEQLVVHAGKEAVESVNRYPDMFCTSLREVIAKHHGVSASQILCGTGLSALLVHCLAAVAGPGDEVVYPWRSFESYPIATATVGATAVPVPLVEGRHDLDAMAAAISERTKAVIVCNPNNPTGAAISLPELTDFIERIDPTVLVLVDEAYIDFADDSYSSIVGSLKKFPNVIVGITFSKAYALAGARVGYLVGDEELLGAISAVATPFGVSAPAQALAEAAMANQKAVAQSVEKIRGERDRILKVLATFGVSGQSQANFIWLPKEVLRDEPSTAADQCLERGVALRPFPEGLRVSVGLPEENDRFLALVGDLLV